MLAFSLAKYRVTSKGIPMMAPDSIAALLAALKAKEGAAGELPAFKPAAMAADPSQGDPSQGDPSQGDPEDSPSFADQADDSAEDNETNQKIVDVLQSQYPKIYAKISAMVEDDPSDNDTSNDADQPDPSGADAPAG